MCVHVQNMFQEYIFAVISLPITHAVHNCAENLVYSQAATAPFKGLVLWFRILPSNNLVSRQRKWNYTKQLFKI